MTQQIEIWADSFHEGQWVAEELCKRFSDGNLEYDRGFIPLFESEVAGQNVRIIVRGDYRAWDPVPVKITEILKFGKPDFIIYGRAKDEVIFVGEETAAVPTGNQSLQRCERMIGACLQAKPAPMAYLLPEYGLHKDGGIRRASIWPYMLGLKLSSQYKTISLLLTFGDEGHPEDYSVGPGPGLMFDLAQSYVLEYIDEANEEWQTIRRECLTQIDKDMRQFILDRAPEMLKVSPKFGPADSGNFELEWPLAPEVKNENAFATPDLVREDNFLSAVYDIVEKKRAYTLVPGSGSKPQSKARLESYAKWHVDGVKSHPNQPVGYAGYKADISQFPETDSGNFHLTSSSDITFMIDDGADLSKAYKTAFPSRPDTASESLNRMVSAKPTFLYTSASMKAGRVFGDPYAGQLSCFTKLLAYGDDDRKTRIVVAYFPLQSYAIFPPTTLDSWEAVSKGLNLYVRMVDVIICEGGVLVFPASREIV